MGVISVVVFLLVCLGVGALLGALFEAAVAFLEDLHWESQERARIEREAQAAAWRIHQQTAHAFGAMLEAARQAEREERPR